MIKIHKLTTDNVLEFRDGDEYADGTERRGSDDPRTGDYGASARECARRVADDASQIRYQRYGDASFTWR